mmetsp:Transcript_10436/g.26791  ORF Transcript_10436/g.26791 Transcript_10436/m.26791 type:complete len:255 (-) Transcript_10436:401-1165(-)
MKHGDSRRSSFTVFPRFGSSPSGASCRSVMSDRRRLESACVPVRHSTSSAVLLRRTFGHSGSRSISALATPYTPGSSTRVRNSVPSPGRFVQYTTGEVPSYSTRLNPSKSELRAATSAAYVSARMLPSKKSLTNTPRVRRGANAWAAAGAAAGPPPSQWRVCGGATTAVEMLVNAAKRPDEVTPSHVPPDRRSLPAATVTAGPSSAARGQSETAAEGRSRYSSRLAATTSGCRVSGRYANVTRHIAESEGHRWY